MDKQELESRIKNALILLTNGHPFKVGDNIWLQRQQTLLRETIKAYEKLTIFD